MAWTLEQHAALQAAIATGSKSVQYADKKVEYRSFAEMMQLLDAMAAELGLAPATNKGRNVGRFEDGLGQPQYTDCR